MKGTACRHFFIRNIARIKWDGHAVMHIDNAWIRLLFSFFSLLMNWSFLYLETCFHSLISNTRPTQKRTKSLFLAVNIKYKFKRLHKGTVNSTACKLVCGNSRPSQMSLDRCLQSGLLQRLCITSTTFYRRFGNTTSCSSSTDNIFHVYDGPFFFLYLKKKSATELNNFFPQWWANP